MEHPKGVLNGRKAGHQTREDLGDKTTEDDITNTNVKHGQPMTSQQLVGISQKVFSCEECIYTTMFESGHMRSLYTMVKVIVFLLACGFLVEGFCRPDGFRYDMNFLGSQFSKFDVAVFTWIAMITCNFGAFIGFSIWRVAKMMCAPDALSSHLVNWLGLVAVFLFQGAMFYIPANVIVTNKVGTSTATVIACEQFRLIMKTHAFIRFNAQRELIIRGELRKKNGDTSSRNFESNGLSFNMAAPSGGGHLGSCHLFKKWLFFMSAPTLVYRDTYPRNSKTRWNHVAASSARFFSAIFVGMILATRVMSPVYSQYGLRHYSSIELVQGWFQLMLPGTLAIVIVVYVGIYCAQNITAELLRFGDRRFVADWWNSLSPFEFWSKWNVLIHDWLHEYVYNDLKLLVGRIPACSLIPAVCVLIISGFGHQYMASVVFGLRDLSVLLIFIGAILGTVAVGHQRPWYGNYSTWMSNFINNGLTVALIRLDQVARQNCATRSQYYGDDSSPMWSVLPAALSCNKPAIE